MNKKYIKPYIVLEDIELQDTIATSLYIECSCKAHKGNHSKCNKGCHNGQAEGHAEETDFFIYNECYE